MFPTSGRPAIEIMMAVWSPGFYRVEDYAKRVEDLSAKAPDGTVLKVEHPEKNRWKVETGGKRQGRRELPAHLQAGRRSRPTTSARPWACSTVRRRSSRWSSKPAGRTKSSSSFRRPGNKR